ncbi:class 1b ribonucleoside-diphosphate reductase subunit alpha [Bacillus amyloliquefaciens]|uniref:class 1b ribonucleoside-diphosphate reductase subunit alpha n=1 Tax=Bacillus amyloliquefaciens TaxID=1390 RepID=UPI00200E7729|nr:class 1b ribonucleoside-diphosphate reductase subunit alpha [Bacillus amyloliquefaciens]UQB84354.1 class 1b ribonucleoside-diphosphate reductase subunit alpha [Bacillus amyloliquefaciens]
MQSPELQKKVKQDTYFKLNNLLNIPKDGKIQLDKDKEAVKTYFLEYVNPNTVFFHTLDEKLDYLVENNYIKKDFLEKYSREFIKTVFQKIYAKKFRFRSFMGAYKFYSQYAMKTSDGERFLERYEDRLAFNALAFASGDEQLALDIAEELINQRYQPATPTFLNIGKARGGEMVSCFLVTISDDLNSIGRAWNTAAQLSAIGGGVGLNLTNLRAESDPIRGEDDKASGVIPVMKVFEDIFSYANQGGVRDGAGVAYLSVHHPDVVKFLSVRKENADEKTRIKTLSLGLIVTDKYYELIKKNDHMYLFSPYDAERVYGVPFSQIDITKEYDNMVNNPKIRKSKILARELETEISNLQNESGYPYIINIDTVNKENPVWGRVIMSNLCTEIFQVQEDSILNDEQLYEFLGNDVSCNLGSTNMVNLMDSPDFGKSVRVMARALTYVTDNSNIESAPPIKNGNDLYHSYGLGVMNYHGFLAKNKIEYGSPEALEIADIYFMLLNYWTLYESNQIAKERNKSFHEFEKSTYADGTYFDKYLKEDDFDFKNERVKEIFDGIFIPKHVDWEELKKSVMKYGVYNAYRLATAPTGSISYVQEATASLHPITQRIEERTEGKRGKVYYPVPYLSDETIEYYVSAFDIDQRKIIDTYAMAQKHVDQGLSMTLFLRAELPEGMYEWKVGSEYPTKKTTRDLSILRNYAWKKGIKSVYYIRTYSEDGDDIGANGCKACGI